MNKLAVFLSLLFSLTFTALANAQSNANQKANGEISGLVVGGSENAGIEFTTISLYDADSETLLDGTITDENGVFNFVEVKAGNYFIEVSFLGFAANKQADIAVAAGQKVDLGKIILTEDAQVLDEIMVTAQKSLIEEKVDRLVYNAENDRLSRGGDAADVLRKVPLLQVDLEGNLSMRGNSNITVLINNKPSTIMAASVADAIKMIPADMIKTVEVITSPSAKYDAEGSGGVINIITKKANLEGYYLNIDSGIGLRGSNLGLNGSYRKGKFGLSLGGYGRAFYTQSESTLTQNTTINSLMNQTLQTSDASNNGIFGRYNLGFDYDISDKQFLSGGINYGIRRFARDQLQATQILSDQVLQSQNLRQIDMLNNSGSVDLNVDYLIKFKPQQELSISTLYSRTDGNSNFVSENLTEEKILQSTLKNIDKSLNEEITIQTDFITPIGSKQILEVGAKGILRNVSSDYSYLFALPGDNLARDLGRPAGTLDYSQDIAAGYTSYTANLPMGYTLKAGLRYEYTRINSIQDAEEVDIPNYQNLVPSVNMSKKLNEISTLKLGYNRRIQRPWVRQLNPNVNVSNNQDIQVGNPNLTPELTDNVELALSTMIKKTYLNLSAFVRNTDNAINQVRTPIADVPGAILTTYENVGTERALGMNAFVNIYLTDNWTINGGVDGYYALIEGQIIGENGQSVTASNDGFNFGGRLMSQLKLKNGWSLQGFTFMRGRRIELQGSRSGFGMYSLGVEKELKNGSIGLAAENFANRGWQMNSELISPYLNQTSSTIFLNRSVKVNFSYKIGSLDARKVRRKTKSVDNKDLMGGGDNQQQQ
jgi:outer membrane receptor for ferrienterochelin and colicin